MFSEEREELAIAISTVLLKDFDQEPNETHERVSSHESEQQALA